MTELLNEKINKSNKFIDYIFLSAAGNFVQMFFGFVTLIIFARYLSREQMGIFVLILLVAQILNNISCIFLEDVSITHSISRSNNKTFKDDFAVSGLNGKILINFVLILFTYIVYSVVILFKDIMNLDMYMTYTLVYFFFISFESCLLKIFQGYSCYKNIALTQMLNGFLKPIILLIFVLSLEDKLKCVICVYIISCMVSIVYLYSKLPFNYNFRIDIKKMREMSSFGYKLGLNNLLNIMFVRVDKIMINFFIGAADVGIYEIASKIPENIRRLYQSFQVVLFPELTHMNSCNDKNSAENIVNNSIRYITFICILFAIIFIFFKYEIIELLFSKKYFDSAPALPLMMFCLSVGLVGNVIGTSFVAFGRPGRPLKINVIDNLLNFILNFMFIPIYGFIGAVYATLIARLFVNPISVFLSNKSSVKIKISYYVIPFVFFILCYIFDYIGINLNYIDKTIIIILYLYICKVTNIFTKLDYIIVTKSVYAFIGNRKATSMEAL